jgi:UDP-N-acetylglucosamine 2-epimerase
VGNVMIDTLRRNLSRIGDGNFAPSPPVAAFRDGKKRYGILTLHRPSNVDTREALTPVWGALSEVARRHGRCDTPDGNRSPGENRPMTAPMERVENRIMSIRGLRRQGFLGRKLGRKLGG